MPRVVDLTQPLGPRTILWPGSRPFEAETALRYDRDGAFARNVALAEHSGTHLDAPVHFDPGALTVDRIPAERLVVPAAVIDVSRESAQDAGFTAGAELIRAHEERDGAIEPGSAVLLRTGWDRHLADPQAYGGASAEALRFPGFGPDAATYLVERGAAGLGIDTLSVDPGHATDFPVHKITLPAGLWHLECLVGLGELPARGATLVVGVIPLEDGSGAFARVLALLPDG